MNKHSMKYTQKLTLRFHNLPKISKELLHVNMQENTRYLDSYEQP